MSVGFFLTVIADDGTESLEQEVFPMPVGGAFVSSSKFHNPPRKLRIVSYRFRICDRRGSRVRYNKIDPCDVYPGDSFSLLHRINMGDFS